MYARVLRSQIHTSRPACAKSELARVGEAKCALEMKEGRSRRMLAYLRERWLRI